MKAETLADIYGDNRTVRCPTCGRRTNADMLTPIGKIKAAKLAQYNDVVRLRGGAVCDGCRERLFRAGVGRAVFYVALDGG